MAKLLRNAIELGSGLDQYEVNLNSGADRASAYRGTWSMPRTSFFEDHYDEFRYPVYQSDRKPGFRLAQRGSIHAIAAHFVNRRDPGIVTMPTGSGKTAVLIAAAFVLRAQRVLVLAPSRLVREQIAEEFKTLETLREIGAIPSTVPNPKVQSVGRRIKSADEWRALKEFDVVVATVPSISPEYDGIPSPPANLFDLVLVDEAHHSPAKTWKAVLEHFESARRVLLTATPFRQDQQEIKGRFLFTYDLRRAFEDKVFGQIQYRPVVVADGETHDVAIARAAEQQVKADRSAGLDHVLMVRTDSRKRAAALDELYRSATGLRLQVITGDKSLKYVRQVMQKLKSAELDGVICVSMMGEGFNFPNFKIAAIHSPHKSLGVTLQFIGRFARTAGPKLGAASFFAVPSEIQVETERLYDSQAVWQEIIQNLSAAKIADEVVTRDVLETFDEIEIPAADLEDLSLYSLEPYFHAKVFQLDSAIDVRGEFAFPNGLQVVYRRVSAEHNAAIFITREITLPRWTTDDRLAIVQPDLFIFHQDKATNLLFVCASRRSSGIYAHFCEVFESAGARPLALARLNRALNELQKAEFFNVGMRNRVQSNSAESYRIVSGSHADRSVQKSDGRLYHRGHCFGRAEDEGALITIGLSSASKVWSNTSSKIPSLISWFAKLARRISSKQEPVTESGLDYLSPGEEITELPSNVISVGWSWQTYRNPPGISYTNSDGQVIKAQLLDLDISLDSSRATKKAIDFVIRDGPSLEYRATFSFDTDRLFEQAKGNVQKVFVELDRKNVDLIAYLNEFMPEFYTDDLSLIQGFSLFRAQTSDLQPFDVHAFEAIDWQLLKVDITREFGPSNKPGLRSVHDFVESYLMASDASIAYYDHGTGEIADFVSVHADGPRLIVRLFHCKASGSSKPGHRVEDCFELFGQVVKSCPAARWQTVLNHIQRRFREHRGSCRFLKGDVANLELQLKSTPANRIDFEFVAVQPGLRRDEMPPNIGNLLAAAGDHLSRGGFLPLRVMGSQ